VEPVVDIVVKTVVEPEYFKPSFVWEGTPIDSRIPEHKFMPRIPYHHRTPVAHVYHYTHNHPKISNNNGKAVVDKIKLLKSGFVENVGGKIENAVEGKIKLLKNIVKFKSHLFGLDK
jgi:hypothetical protein